MDKHTPGPWSYCCDKCLTVSAPDHPIARIEHGAWGDTFPSLRQIGPSIGAKYEPYIEMIEYGEIDEETAIANAHLIAAAPELLAALEYVLPAIDKEWGECGCVGSSPDCPNPSPCYNCVIRAAIAHAKGES